MIFSENRSPLCANAALRVGISRYRPIFSLRASAMTCSNSFLPSTPRTPYLPTMHVGIAQHQRLGEHLFIVVTGERRARGETERGRSCPQQAKRLASGRCRVAPGLIVQIGHIRSRGQAILTCSTSRIGTSYAPAYR